MEDIVERVSLELRKQLAAVGKILPAPAAATRRIVIACSGGLDSSVLLHALAADPEFRAALRVVHVNHRLHDSSAAWAQHCEHQAQSLCLPIEILTVEEPPVAGQSIEAWARARRYALLREVLEQGDLLLTAHHQDDQTETFMLQLLRGAGPHGLSAIRSVQKFEPGWLARPMLALTRKELQDYQTATNLSFIEDPTNASPDFDRNYLRTAVLPALRLRWPHVGDRIRQAVKLQQAAAELIDCQADVLLQSASNAGATSIALSPVLDLDPINRFWVLRRWLTGRSLALPDQVHFDQIERTFFAGPPNTTARVVWKGIEMRYFDGRLYAHEVPAAHDPNWRMPWDLQSSLQLPTGRLTVETGVGGGLKLSARRSRNVVVGYYRNDGLRCHPSGRGHSQRLKKLFQEWSIPPWQRQRIPLLLIDDVVAAVVPYCVCRGFDAAPGEPSLILTFADPLSV